MLHLLLHEVGDEMAVDMLYHVGAEALLGSPQAAGVQHGGEALRRAHVILALLKSGGGAHVGQSAAQVGDHLAINAVTLRQD